MRKYPIISQTWEWNDALAESWAAAFLWGGWRWLSGFEPREQHSDACWNRQSPCFWRSSFLAGSAVGSHKVGVSHAGARLVLKERGSCSFTHGCTLALLWFVLQKLHCEEAHGAAEYTQWQQGQEGARVGFVDMVVAIQVPKHGWPQSSDRSHITQPLMSVLDNLAYPKRHRCLWIEDWACKSPERCRAVLWPHWLWEIMSRFTLEDKTVSARLWEAWVQCEGRSQWRSCGGSSAFPCAGMWELRTWEFCQSSPVTENSALWVFFRPYLKCSPPWPFD